VDAGFLDVLHDAGQEQLGAVVQGVDVDLDRVVEELVDQDRLRAGLASSLDLNLGRASLRLRRPR